MLLFCSTQNCLVIKRLVKCKSTIVLASCEQVGGRSLFPKQTAISDANTLQVFRDTFYVCFLGKKVGSFCRAPVFASISHESTTRALINTYREHI